MISNAKYQIPSASDDHICFTKIHTATYGFIHTTTYGSKSIKYQGPFIWNKMMKQKSRHQSIKINQF